MKRILALLFLVLNVSAVLAEQPLPSGYFSIPVLITLSDGSKGSGFFLDASNHIFFATARHVLFNENGQLRATNACLLSNQDNPTNHGRLEITIDLAGFSGSSVAVELYDAMGKNVMTVSNLKADTYIVQRGNLPSGIYFLKIQANGKMFDKFGA